MRTPLSLRSVTAWRQFWITIGSCALCLIGIDRVGGLTLKHLQRRATTTDMLGLINNAKRAKADVLILGTSRARHGYNDQLLSQLLNQRVFNAALGGSALLYAKGTYDLVRKEHPPRIVILDVGYFEQERDRIHILDSHYGESDDLDQLLVDGDWRQRVKFQSHLYRYNGAVIPILQNFRRSAEKPFGFTPLAGTWEGTNAVEAAGPHVSPTAAYLSVLTNLVENIKQDGGKLIFVETPHLSHPFPQPIINAYEEIAKSRNIPFIHLEPTEDERQYFKDPGHLNEGGAQRVTIRLAELVRPYVPQNAVRD